MNKTIQNLKVEIESIKQTQNAGNLGNDKLPTQTEISEAIITKIIHDMKERTPGIEDTMEKMDTSGKENVKSEK